VNRRLSAVGALIELAAGDDYRDRADAGRALAVFAEVTEAREPLLRLVLDAGDTFVTLTTAEALLRRQDIAGFTIIAEALTSADVQQQTYIHQAVTAVFMLYASERDRAVEACDALTHDANDEVRQGAAELREMLVQVRPVLYPAS
jgi:hypothetical protein